MKTITTVLPIYDRLSKQFYYRAKADEKGVLNIIKTPQYRLPSFQWLDDGDLSSSVSKIEIIEPFKRPLEYTGWNGNDFNTFLSSGLEITSAINLGGAPDAAYINQFLNEVHGRELRFIGTLTLNSGDEPGIYLDDPTTIQYLNVGANDIILNHNAFYSGGPELGYFDLEGTTATNFSLSNVSISRLNVIDITDYFVSLPVLGHDYFYYNGDTLNYWIPEGIYYLKITMDNDYAYYSEVFQVDCIYDNLLIEDWTNVGFETFTADNPAIITSAIESAGSGYAKTNIGHLEKGDIINIKFYFTLNLGTLPDVALSNSDLSLADTAVCVEGINEMQLESQLSGDNYIVFNTNGNDVGFSTLEILVHLDYSDRYIKIDFSNNCDLGDILYQDYFTQTLYLETEPMEMTFPQEDKGVENGEGRFIRTFARQVKKYLVRTLELPDYMVEVFHRMKLHDTVELTNLVGDTNDVYNLEVEHEWLFDDRYYAKCELTFDYDETFVINGCCNNLT